MTALLGLAAVVAAFQQQAVWKVGPVELEIGAEPSGGPDEFGRISGVIQLPDGSVVVADQMNDEIRAFEPSGKSRWVRGRSGAGPGEFQLITWLGWCGGSIVVVDGGGNKRVTRFDPSGRATGSQAVFSPNPGRSPWDVRCDDQAFIVASWPYPPMPPKPGPVQPDVTVGAFDLAGDSVGTIGRFPGPEIYVLPSLRGTTPRPLGAKFFIGVLDSRAFIGASNRPTVQVRDLGGGAHAEFRVPFARRAVKDADIDAWIQSASGKVADPARAEAYRVSCAGSSGPTTCRSTST